MQTTVVTPEEIIEGFGRSISYEQVVEILPRLGKRTQVKIEEAVAQKQKAFWNRPEVIDYYVNRHRLVPFVERHWGAFLRTVNVQGNETIADLGCGAGGFISRVLDSERAFGKIIGIDYASKMLEVAQETFSEDGRIELIEHDLSEGICLESKSVDKVISNWGIVYLSEEILHNKVFPEIHRVLKPGGILIYSALIKGVRLASFKRKFLAFPEILLGRKWHIIKEATQFEKDLKMLFPIYQPDKLVKMTEDTGLEGLRREFTIVGGSVTITARKR